MSILVNLTARGKKSFNVQIQCGIRKYLRLRKQQKVIIQNTFESRKDGLPVQAG